MYVNRYPADLSLLQVEIEQGHPPRLDDCTEQNSGRDPHRILRTPWYRDSVLDLLDSLELAYCSPGVVALATGNCPSRYVLVLLPQGIF